VDFKLNQEGRNLRVLYLGQVPYSATAERQEKLRDKVKAGSGEEHLLLLEHDPVFTLGRNAKEEDVVADAEWLNRHGIDVQTSNRGGQVTYHGPGQLVGYPIIDLDPDRRDVRLYVRDLQEVLLRTLADWGIEARRREGAAYIGIWVGDRKIASLGVHLSRWVTLHGFALNVRPDLDPFSAIVPCGLPEVRMTSMREELGQAPTPQRVATGLAKHFADVFARNLCWGPGFPQGMGPETLPSETKEEVGAHSE
jgi:lipoyl(octanoyl) transferase